MSAPIGGDQGPDDVRDVAAGEVVGLQAAGRDAVLLGQAGLDGHDLRADDDVRVHLAEGHPDEVQQAHVRAGGLRLDPQVEVLREQDDQDQRGDHGGRDEGEIHGPPAVEA